jgi:hypothetical protein
MAVRRRRQAMKVHLAAVVFLLFSGLAQGQEEVPWQLSVTGQIEALRSDDADGALGLAAEGFRANYTDAARFLADIRRSGYGPIADARSYSLGTFRKTGKGSVLQVVKLTGADQKLYEAVYEMVEEAGEGWRVLGVVLRRVPGLGI